jgi:acetyl/propionyl-CoA carboxylase alpha subunit
LEVPLPAEEAGSNFLIDGYEILGLEEDPETRRRVDVNVEQGRRYCMYVAQIISNHFIRSLPWEKNIPMK